MRKGRGIYSHCTAEQDYEGGDVGVEMHFELLVVGRSENNIYCKFKE
jgi:hypothetical protein